MKDFNEITKVATFRFAFTNISANLTVYHTDTIQSWPSGTNPWRGFVPAKFSWSDEIAQSTVGPQYGYSH